METRTANEHFFERLPVLEHFADSADLANFTQAPDDWLMVVTDVIGSTAAIHEGRYRDVNALGVASIIAVRNAMPGVSVPFVFGGDGATLLVPGTRRAAVEAALRGVSTIATNTFRLSFRTSIVPVVDLHRAGHEVLVSRFRSGPHVVLASFAGSGIREGERWVKDATLGKAFELSAGDEAADLSGFECRWRPVTSRHGAVLCLLVAPLDPLVSLGKVMAAIAETIGEDGQGCPVSSESLRMASVLSDFREEVGIRSGEISGLNAFRRRVRARAAILVATWTKLTGKSVAGFNAARYTSEVPLNTDYRKFDGVLRMVIDVTAQQRQVIESMLVAEQELGHIAWGMHVTDSALITCMVDDYEGDHVHFVDGADGGYTMAARQLKAQLEQALL